MSDKIEYSRLIMKRSDITGVSPTTPTGTTLSSFTDTDIFEGEFFLNTADDLLWIRTATGILPITLSGSTGSTIPTLNQVLFAGDNTSGLDLVVSSGDTIVFQGLNTGSTSTILGLDASGNTISTNIPAEVQSLDSVLSFGNQSGIYDIVMSSGTTIQYLSIPSGTTTTILGLDASGNTITTTGGGGTPSLDAVLAVGNTTGIYDIIVSTGTTIQSPSGENEIYLQKADQMGLKSTYTLTGTNYEDELKMRAPSGTDAGLEITSTDTTNGLLTKTEYRPTSKRDISFDSLGAFVETRLESSGYTIDLSNTSAGYLTIDGLLAGTAVDLLGLDSNNRVVPYTIPLDIYSTGGTYSNGTITIDRNDGNSFNITGLFTGYTSLVESVTAGTGLSGSSTTGNITLINTAPDQVVSLSGGTGITTGGSYPNFTITNSLPDQTVVLNNGSNISVSGTYPNFTIAATGLTDYYVTGGTFSTSGGTLTLDRQNGSVQITGFTANVGTFGITIDGAGTAITTGVKGYIVLPYDCIVNSWSVVADQSGSVVVDVWKASSYTIPTSAAQSIAGTEKPTLSSQQINTDLSLSSWTTGLVVGDVIAFNVDSASTITRATIEINVIKI